MSTNPPAREIASSGTRQGIYVLAALFGVMVVFLAQGILERVARRAQQGFAPPGSNVQTLATSTLILPALQVAVCILFLSPWAPLGDRCRLRLPYAGGLSVWVLGVFTGNRLGSVEFLLVSHTLQTAGAATMLPAAFAVVMGVQSYRSGFLISLAIAFPAPPHLPGSLIADLIARSMNWRAAPLLIPVVTAPPLILNWLATPSGLAETGPDDNPTLESRPGQGRTVMQTLPFGVVLFGFRIHPELAFFAHYDRPTFSDAAEYSKAHNGLVSFPLIAGLTTGFVVGAMIVGGRTNTWLAWSIVATGARIVSVPLLLFDIAILTGAVLASVGLRIGLSGQLVMLLRPAVGNRISRAAAPFQVVQNLGYRVGIRVPTALILALGDTVTLDVRVHLFLDYSLILLITGLTLVLRESKNRVTAQQDSKE